MLPQLEWAAENKYQVLIIGPYRKGCNEVSHFEYVWDTFIEVNKTRFDDVYVIANAEAG